MGRRSAHVAPGWHLRGKAVRLPHTFSGFARSVRVPSGEVGFLMGGRARGLWVAALVVAATALGGVSIAWACTAPDFGTPQTPAAPPPSTPPPSPSGGGGGGGPSPAPAAGAGAGAPSSGAPAAAAPATAPNHASAGHAGAGSSASGSTSGAGSSRASGTTSGGQRRVAAPRSRAAAPHSRAAAPHSSGAGSSGSGSSAPSGAGSASGGGTSSASGGRAFGSPALAARAKGATAGVSHRAGHRVFASSVPPRTAAAPSARSATGDLWSGFGAPARSPVSAAQASSSGQGGGVGAQVLAGVVILGLGLVGLFGGVLVTLARRRRATAGSSGTGSGATER